MSRYIIIEDFSGNISLINGKNNEIAIFANKKDAEEYAKDFQNPTICKLND